MRESLSGPVLVGVTSAGDGEKILPGSLRLCYSGCSSNTGSGNVYHQNEKSLRPIKRDLLKPRPASSVREATRPPEAGKILCNFFLPDDKSISYIVTNSNTNN